MGAAEGRRGGGAEGRRGGAGGAAARTVAIRSHPSEQIVHGCGVNYPESLRSFRWIRGSGRGSVAVQAQWQFSGKESRRRGGGGIRRGSR